MKESFSPIVIHVKNLFFNTVLTRFIRESSRLKFKIYLVLDQARFFSSKNKDFCPHFVGKQLFNIRNEF